MFERQSRACATTLKFGKPQQMTIYHPCVFVRKQSAPNPLKILLSTFDLFAPHTWLQQCWNKLQCRMKRARWHERQDWLTFSEASKKNADVNWSARDRRLSSRCLEVSAYFMVLTHCLTFFLLRTGLIVIYRGKYRVCSPHTSVQPPARSSEHRSSSSHRSHRLVELPLIHDRKLVLSLVR